MSALGSQWKQINAVRLDATIPIIHGDRHRGADGMSPVSAQRRGVSATGICTETPFTLLLFSSAHDLRGSRSYAPGTVRPPMPASPGPLHPWLKPRPC